MILCLSSIHHCSADEAQEGKPAKTTAEKNDFDFDGTWKPKGAILSGVFIPPPALKTITLKIEKNNYEVTVEGEDHSDVGTFTVDTTFSPNRMTLISTEGPNQGKTILAIYEIKNANAMRVCYDLSGTDFPKEFKAPKDSELYVVGYRRQLAKENDVSEKPAASDK
ncbi:hypothetical protein RMSM_05944 [Rhodopirellula maiorica SM1]|uniref:Uncharacterized protein n=1 Tax=Rhodopirellula maiorica SM1 TaxID=1265738 RepID=M5RP19_9BACT|nr:hypothetical protein RMSM_05944 [Rhodopirellula maiorica SM1]